MEIDLENNVDVEVVHSEPFCTKGSITEQIGVGLIETDELAAILNSSPESVRLVNATWFWTPEDPDHKELYRNGHIPGDVYFDIGHIANKDSGLLATLPTLETWIEECKRIGVKKDDQIVVYENSRIYAGPRAAWMFR